MIRYWKRAVRRVSPLTRFGNPLFSSAPRLIRQTDISSLKWQLKDGPVGLGLAVQGGQRVVLVAASLTFEEVLTLGLRSALAG